MMLLRILTASLAITILAIAPVLGNTEILNLASHPLCSTLPSTASREALAISHDWPVLHPGATPNFSAIEAKRPAQTGAVQREGGEGHWFRLELQEQGGVLEKGWTVRVSWPANHHVSLGLNIYTPEEMLQQKRSGSHFGARKSKQPQDDDAPRSSLYLHLLAEVEGVPIPPSSLQNAAQAQLHPALRLLSMLASWYLNPLSGMPVIRAGSVSEEDSVGGSATTLTPIHLTLEPLLFGVAPRSITLHLLGVLAVIMAGLGVFVRADGMDKVGGWVQEVVQDRRENEVGEGS